jgi:multisubunit Na+/H+ antiporter MnhC subunit
MSLILSVLAGALFAISAYLLLRKNRLEALIGFALLTNAANIAILAGSGWKRGERPPILGDDYRQAVAEGAKACVSTVDPSAYADPVPQALVLTAIVIGFALTSFAMALAANLSEREAEEAAKAEAAAKDAENAPEGSA